MRAWGRLAIFGVLAGLFWLAQVVLPAAAQGATGGRVALVVGNEKYESVDQLAQAPKDADHVAEALEKLDFEVTLVKDATRADFGRALKEFGSNARGAEVALLYYAGHAVQISGVNYLIPIDIRMSTPQDAQNLAINVEQLMDLMTQANTKLNVLLLDACRNNPWASAWSGSETEFASRGLDIPVKPKAATFIGFATSPYMVAADNGDYANALVQQVTRDCVSLADAMAYVSDQVAAKSQERQIPWNLASRSAANTLFLAGCKGDTDKVQVQVVVEQVEGASPIPPDLQNNRGLRKPAPKKLVGRVASMARKLPLDAILQPPSPAPSPAAGSFVRPYAPSEGEAPKAELVGTYESYVSPCTNRLVFEDVQSSPITFESLIAVESGVAIKLGLPMNFLSFGGKKVSLMGVDYAVTEKRIIAGGREALVRCCVENRSQCSDRIISEWWRGAGELYQVNNSKLGLQLVETALIGAPANVDLGTKRGFSMSQKWNEDAYFAYRTERVKIPTCEEYLNRTGGSDENRLTFTGVSGFLDSEQDSRRDSRRDASIQLVEYIGQRFDVRGDDVEVVANAVVSGLNTDFVCVNKVSGPRPQWQARTRMIVAAERVNSVLARMGSGL